MNLDILSKLPFLNQDESDDDLSDEEREAQAKKDRIKFHRESVRNGPVKFKSVTSGMIRRAQARDLARRTKKVRRTQVQNYVATQRFGASVRGHLQHAGILPFINREVDPQQQVISAAWLVQRFGVNVEVDGVETDEVSFAYHDVLNALSAALKFHGQVVGQPDLRVPDDYVVPIYEQGTAPAGIEALRSLGA